MLKYLLFSNVLNGFYSEDLYFSWLMIEWFEFIKVHSIIIIYLYLL